MISARRQQIENVFRSLRVLRRMLVDRQGMPRFLAGQATRAAHRARITPAQWAILAVVLRGKNVGIKEIAEELHITSSATTQLVDELVEKKYLVRTVNAHDRRGLSLKIPAARKKTIRDLRQRRFGELVKLFRNFSDAELAQFSTLCGKVADGASQQKVPTHDRRR